MPGEEESEESFSERLRGIRGRVRLISRLIKCTKVQFAVTSKWRGVSLVGLLFLYEHKLLARLEHKRIVCELCIKQIMDNSSNVEYEIFSQKGLLRYSSSVCSSVHPPNGNHLPTSDSVMYLEDPGWDNAYLFTILPFPSWHPLGISLLVERPKTPSQTKYA